MIDLYDFISALNEASSPKDIINPGASGTASNIIWQTWKVKKGQRFCTNFVLGEMGATLPYSIGLALATGKRIIHIEGDGGFQMNIQELETVRRLNLPIIMFIINNNGYGSIRSSQQKHFGRLTGADDTSGLTLPGLHDIADAYDIDYDDIGSHGMNREYIKNILVNYETNYSNRPLLVEVIANPDQQYRHRVESKLVDGVMTSGRLEDV